MTLYLLPNLLDENADFNKNLPPYLTSVIKSLGGIIAENATKSTRYLSHFLGHEIARKLPCSVFNGKTSLEDVDFHLEPLKEGKNLGYLSDAGLPCVADPGAPLVFRARQLGIPIEVIPGPSALFQSLMLSGLSGQKFTFHGYLPKKPDEKEVKLQEMIKQAERGYTQIFIEAPHQSENLFAWLCDHVSENLYLSLSIDLSTTHESVQTHTIKTWKSFPAPSLSRKRVTYLLGFNQLPEKKIKRAKQFQRKGN